MWHTCADELARHFTVIATYLRGYGVSDKPASDAHHTPYSKRAMAADQIAVMRHFGFERFLLCGHDRGARVAHRMAMDFPDAIDRLMLLDIAPTLTMYEATDLAFARANFHWYFLIQPAPLPEALIGGNPNLWLEQLMAKHYADASPFAAAFAPHAMQAYRDTFAAPCEDYRASVSMDLDHGRADLERGRKIACPVRVLWGEQGTLARCFDVLREWCRVARDVSGHGLPATGCLVGHYIPEEQPVALLT
ncbi:Haloacetate dehalogenase H-1 [Candidatus Paraburkholderia calva]|nr:Haloacetate dehalogenase H-1 [Candidatus Paraburkholderia calva]